MVTVKGICMGAADVIPGVSGGTIAFMTGIYDTLVGSISSINTEAVKLLFTGKFGQFWKHINGNFLLSLVAGILVSILSLAKLMQYLLNYHPIQTWAFFFGLIVASSIFILKGIDNWKVKDFIQLVFGIVLGVAICTLSPTETPDGLWFIFISGAIAICAMILPGISGSFILLILGKYEYMMGTIADIVSGKGNLTDFRSSRFRARSPHRDHSVLQIPPLAAGTLPPPYPACACRLYNRIPGESMAMEQYARHHLLPVP